MQTHTAQQEILLMTGTSFSARTWCANDDVEDNKNNTPEDRLKEACWNGLLPEILPEICTPATGQKKMFLWQITQAFSFIDIEMGEVPGTAEKYFSINPYSFLDVQFFS
jgi:hypothetical protein